MKIPGKNKYFHKGQEWTMKALSKEYGISVVMIRHRLNMSWEFDDAVTTPLYTKPKGAPISACQAKKAVKEPKKALYASAVLGYDGHNET